ncbi:MAG: DNA-3-methyladenine glycosylase I [Coriobacteriia bacterium]|nr:DNA-3-methyladenine glycosylase I [Coriobacteriia bacterium]
MQGPPVKIAPKTSADYLAQITRAVFEAGLSYAVIDQKWPGFEDAFCDFDPETVAGFTNEDVERLMRDMRIVRNRRKIMATIDNAGEMIIAEREFGTFKKYLRSHGSFEATVRDLRRRFKFLGDSGAYFFLYVVGEKVPPHDEWMAAHPDRRPK